jgi:hypothetical protein
MKDMFGDEIKPGERAPISLLPGPYPYGGFGWEDGPHDDVGEDVFMAWNGLTGVLEMLNWHVQEGLSQLLVSSDSSLREEQS